VLYSTGRVPEEAQWGVKEGTLTAAFTSEGLGEEM